jgi:rifampicin phosphotransferase
MLISVTVDSLKTLADITEVDRPRVGGKAYNCARLKHAGFPVPDALVVAADATDEDVTTVADHPWVQSLPSDTLFAVRSSGLAEDSEGDSFAGIHETSLNVSRDELVDAVLMCRRSAQSEQARAYREARQLRDSASGIAVLVQCMVAAARSGVAFTVNPVTGADELVVNSIDGLGEALVSGLVNPDEQHLSKDDPSELARLLVAIEAHYGAPQDVEFCHDGRQYWIVQSRPVTTRRAVPISVPEAPASSSEIEWTRANLAEVLPDQLSPQALDVYVDLLDRSERAFFGRLMAPEAELGPVIKAFHGRLYFNLAQLRHVTMTIGEPFAELLRSLGHAGQIHPEDEVAARPPLKAFVRALPDIARLAMYDLRIERMFRDHQVRTERGLARLAASPAALSDREIWATIQWWLDMGPEWLPPVFVMSNVQTRVKAVRKACERVGVAYEDLAYPQLAAGQRSVSSQQAFDLVALADIARNEPKASAYLGSASATFDDFRTSLAGTGFLHAFDEFLARYGHRGRYESDWSIPRMHENPAPILFAVREQLSATPEDPTIVATRQSEAAAAAWQAFEARLTFWQKYTLLPRVRATMRQLKQQYLWREQVRSDITRVMSALRVWHLKLADRFVERGWIDRRDDYFLLHLREVQRACEDAASGVELRPIAARRASELAAQRDLRMPLFMRATELPALLAGESSPNLDDDHQLIGLCTSPGAVEAEVVVMRDPSEFAAMKRGAILVAPATDPSWTPLFTLASGVIVEVGGMLSHASTIAREYGLPALANVKNATSRLRTGDRVWLQASAGRVVRCERQE